MRTVKEFRVGFAHLILLLLISVVIVASIGYYAYKNGRIYFASPGHTQSTTPTTNNITNWKTYTNSRFKYKFMYPFDWVIASVDGSNDKPPNYPTTSPSEAQNILFVSQNQDLQMQLFINVIDNPTQLKIKDFFKKANWSEIYINSMEETTINGFQAVKMNLQNDISTRQYFIAIDNHILNIQFSYSLDSASNQVAENTFTKILYSFDSARNLGPIKEDAAIMMIENLPQVKKYMETTENPIVQIDKSQSDTNMWVVHVFEDRGDHVATFGWFSVNKTTGKIKDELTNQYVR